MCKRPDRQIGPLYPRVVPHQEEHAFVVKPERPTRLRPLGQTSRRSEGGDVDAVRHVGNRPGWPPVAPLQFSLVRGGDRPQ